MIKPPKILTDAGYEIYCDTFKLRRLDVPVVDFEINKLVWNFNLPFWEKDKTDDWNLTPREVINKAAGSFRHQKRIGKVNLKYPIFLLYKNKKWLVVDGVHRLVKAHLAGQNTIKAKIFTWAMIKQCQNLKK